MRDQAAWSLSFGRWGGVSVRLHASFLVLAVGTFFLATRSGERSLVGVGVAALAILLVSVVLHELGHLGAIFRVGGHADQIVLGPFGGWSHGEIPQEPQCELLVALAGPAVNLAVCAVCVPLLLFVEQTNPVELLNPLQPMAIDLSAVDAGGLRRLGLKLTFWLNWVLLLVNFLPARPFDGGRALRAVLWPAFGYRTAALAVSRVAKATALALCLLAWAMSAQQADEMVPSWSWAPLVLLAMLLYFSARDEVAWSQRHAGDDEPFGYDFSQGYTSLQRAETDRETDDDDDPGAVQQWLERRRKARQRQRRLQEQAEEARVDAILARLHETGLDQLPSEDRALLERVAARYRNRIKDGSARD